MLSASGLDFASLLSRGEEVEEMKNSIQDSSIEIEDLSSHGSFRKRQMSLHSVSYCKKMLRKALFKVLYIYSVS